MWPASSTAGTRSSTRCAPTRATADVSPKLKKLLVVAGLTQQGGKQVTAEADADARREGATDRAIHDTCLVR